MTATMIFAKVDVNAPNHPRFHKVGPAGAGMWLGALCYAREYETDGIVPRTVFHGLYGVGREVGEEWIVKLVTAGLLADHGDDLEVLKYSERNETKADIAKRRTETRDRVAKHRAEKAALSSQASSLKRVTESVTEDVTNAVGNASVPDSDSDSLNRDPERDPDPEIDQGGPALSKAAQRERWEADIRAAYERGIAKGKGGEYLMPPQAQGDLNALLPRFARWGPGNPHNKRPGSPIGGAHLLEWVEDFAEDFGRFVADHAKGPDAVGFYSWFSPRGFGKFLSETSMKREAKRVG